jgi:hypothetical protein
MQNKSNVVKQYALMCCNSKVFYQQTQIMKNCKRFFGGKKSNVNLKNERKDKY